MVFCSQPETEKILAETRHFWLTTDRKHRHLDSVRISKTETEQVQNCSNVNFKQQTTKFHTACPDFFPSECHLNCACLKKSPKNCHVPATQAHSSSSFPKNKRKSKKMAAVHGSHAMAVIVSRHLLEPRPPMTVPLAVGEVGGCWHFSEGCGHDTAAHPPPPPATTPGSAAAAVARRHRRTPPPMLPWSGLLFAPSPNDDVHRSCRRRRSPLDPATTLPPTTTDNPSADKDHDFLCHCRHCRRSPTTTTSSDSADNCAFSLWSRRLTTTTPVHDDVRRHLRRLHSATAPAADGQPWPLRTTLLLQMTPPPPPAAAIIATKSLPPPQCLFRAMGTGAHHTEGGGGADGLFRDGRPTASGPPLAGLHRVRRADDFG